MKGLVFVVGLLSSFSRAFAGQETLICSNEHYQLAVHETAVVTFRTATLSFSNRQISLKCQGELDPKTQNLSFMCQEDRAGEGKYLAGLVLTGNSGTAQIAHERMYPLTPQVLAQLECETVQP